MTSPIDVRIGRGETRATRAGSLHVALLLMLSCMRPCAGAERVVAVDQTGYRPAAAKFVFSSQVADSFSVFPAAGGPSVLRGGMDLWRALDAPTGYAVYRGDFTALSMPGSYRIVTSHGDTSSPFVVSDSVYNDVFRKSLKGFYFQRCGMTLLPAYAGVYQRMICHRNDGIFHTSSDSAGLFHLATGGWHDAGDYGKYVVNAGISVGTLMLAYEMFPAKFSVDDLGIPESGNGIPDILDESRYELEWLLKMQRADGAFWFKLTPQQFEGFVMPSLDHSARYIYQVSTTATGDAAAVLAIAAKVYFPFDSTFAKLCLSAAENAWNFLSQNGSIIPPGGFHNPPGTGTGEYGDSDDSDERLWASAELFDATGASVYNDYFLAHYASGFSSPMSWPNLRPLALLAYLRSSQLTASASVQYALRSSLDAFCSAMVTKRNASGYQVLNAAGEYYWGSNSGPLNSAILLLAGKEQTGADVYADVAEDQLHYILGANGLAKCFVTGIGENPPLQIHHRPSASDGIAAPIPGLLAGGPNQYGGDPVLDALIQTGTPPALCYLDTVASYASNEICLNWNAPLVFVAGYFQAAGGTSRVVEPRLGRPSGFILEQAYPNPFNPTTTIRYGLPETSRVALEVFSVLGQRVASLVDDVEQEGFHQIRFDGSRLASGVYFYRMSVLPWAGEGYSVLTRKFLLLR